MKRKRLDQLLMNEAGMESIQAVVILAVAALILTGMQQLWSPDGGGGIRDTAERVVIAAIKGEKLDGPGNGTIAPPKVDPETDPPIPEEPPADPPLESHTFEEVYVAYLADKTKRFADEALQAAKESLSTDIEDLTWLDPEFAAKTDIILREGMVELAGALFDGAQATGGLVEADRDIRGLAEAGKFNEAWNRMWSAPARYATEVFLSSKPVSAALNELPTSVSVAIQVGLPNVVESATAAAADKLWEPVGGRINNKLWEWYDAGYLPRAPRIPRDHF